MQNRIPRLSFFALWLAAAAYAAPREISYALPQAPSADPRPAPLAKAPLIFPDGKKITVELASTPRDREAGLMNRKSLPKNYGMLFVFPVEQRMQFWMKNTWVDLDMVFIGKDKRITEIHRDVPRSYENTPENKLARRNGTAQFVLELPRGAAARHHLEKGQAFQFDVPIPPQ